MAPVLCPHARMRRGLDLAALPFRAAQRRVGSNPPRKWLWVFSFYQSSAGLVQVSV
jgi:hypothetical protein